LRVTGKAVILSSLAMRHDACSDSELNTISRRFVVRIARLPVGRQDFV
jgi:hypothetical protein